VITSIAEGVNIDETHNYINMLYSYKPGDTVPLEVMRDSKKVELKITLGEIKKG